MKTKINVFAILVAISISSCATLFTSSKQAIYFETTPPGAKILINGIDQGVTPATITVKKKLESPTIMLKMDGYEVRTFELEQTLTTASIFNLLNIFGWGIDIATGKVKSYDQKAYNIELDVKK